MADTALARSTNAASVLFRRLRFIPHLIPLLGSAGVAAIVLILRHSFSNPKKPSRYIQNPVEVGESVAGSDYDEFDIIIVGGGTSGCALASRLSEDPSIRVLLLESGGSGQALPLSKIPSGFSKLFHTRHVFELRTEPQIFASKQRRYWPRAKLLGGCSSINAQMAQYGAPEDFDQWAKTIGDDSWSWKNFSRYFRKFEKCIPHPDYPTLDISVRGTDGPVRVGYFNTISNTANGFIKACMTVGIPFTPDFNGPTGTMGVNRVLTYIDENRERVSSESAYLTKDVLSRPNLSVAIHAHVTRILFDKVDGETRAVGVEYAKKETGPRYRSRARKEVILSAGAVHSPHILMLSGIGSIEQLSKHGIPIVHELPGVGANLVDHPVIDVYFKDKTESSINFLRGQTLSERLKVMRALVQYKILRTGGPLATNFGEAAAFVRSDDPLLFSPAEYPEKLEDSTAGPGSPDLELFCTPLAYKEHGSVGFDVHTRALHCYLLRPTSRGNIFLKSANPFENPGINPNYLQTSEDLQKLLRGTRLCLKIARADPLPSLLDHDSKHPDLDHDLHLKTDEELIEVIKERVETIYHPASTCRMAPLEENGVVDSQLRVYGIRGLRVCDASFFPWVISGHTTGAVYASAEKLADDIKAEFH